MLKDIEGLFVSRSGVSIYKMVSLYIYFLLIISLLSDHNNKNKHINITISKFVTIILIPTYSRHFLMFSEITGFFSYQMELRFTKWSQYLCV